MPLAIKCRAAGAGYHSLSFGLNSLLVALLATFRKEFFWLTLVPASSIG
jgi:hypothetical protein